MHPLAKAFTFHLLAPYAVQLALAFLLIRSVAGEGFIVLLLFGGWLALIGIALISVPFGIAHVMQVFSFARCEQGPGKQFMVGFLNPSFAFLTVAVWILIAPRGFLEFF